MTNASDIGNAQTTVGNAMANHDMEKQNVCKLHVLAFLSVTLTLLYD